MPLVNSNFKPHTFIRGSHIETILPGLFRKVNSISSIPERISTPDHDFLDLDWISPNQKNIVIISHGLEGNSRKPYIKGMAKHFNEQGFTTLCWNFRGCSGKINNTKRFYHSGSTDDLKLVIDHAISLNYKRIALIGFSLGGNITLKYLGENKGRLPKEIITAVTYSVPLDLSASADEISKPENWIYSLRFLFNLKNKLRLKHKVMGNKFPINGISNIYSLRTFDNIFTGPLHGFKDAEDYYSKSSSLQYLDQIEIPTLLVNSLNDPFLPKECYPTDLLHDLKKVYFEFPKYGGHCGFGPPDAKGVYWSEKRAFEFISKYITQ